jgi:D-3-phosphoglycerate dehydrogenase
VGTVAITDFTFPSLEIESSILGPLGHTVLSGQCKSTETLIPLVAEADAVITQFAPINAEVIAAMTKARVIVRYGIGYDNVDIEAAAQRGIPVCNIPGYCVDEVADHTLAFILAATRQVVSNAIHVRNGLWGLATPLAMMRTLRDMTVGCIGFGRIGREVLLRLAPFKCRRLVYDPVVAAKEIIAHHCEPASLQDLLAQSDIVTLHCPSTPETRRLLNAETLRKLKPGAWIINLARGDLIDTAALVEALRIGRLGGAAIDVCDPEPIPAESPLRSLPNVIVSSHIASASENAVRTLRETVARIAATAMSGERPPNIVNGV